jgi:putative Ca2+/H+ antiporter (TMEM165/GDT1 family)
MNTAQFLSAFGIVFLAELGDKTQLTAMTLATHYPWKKVFIGIAAAFALLNLAAVFVGKLLFTSGLPLFWIKLFSAGLFLFFGINSLLEKSFDEHKEEEEEQRFARKGPIVTAFFMILLAEMGDKTQLVTASLAAQQPHPLMVFLGSTLALWSVSLIGIFLGRQLTRFVPLFYIHRAAGVLFLVFAAGITWQAFTG